MSLARDSRAIWREWEQEGVRELISADGVVALGPDVRRRAELTRAGGARARIITSTELSAERLPCSPIGPMTRCLTRTAK